MKLDYFYLVSGVVVLIVSVWYAFARAIDVFWLIYLILSLMLLFKSYYQERMSVLNWLKKMKLEVIDYLIFAWLAIFIIAELFFYNNWFNWVYLVVWFLLFTIKIFSKKSNKKKGGKKINGR